MNEIIEIDGVKYKRLDEPQIPTIKVWIDDQGYPQWAWKVTPDEAFNFSIGMPMLSINFWWVSVAAPMAAVEHGCNFITVGSNKQCTLSIAEAPFYTKNSFFTGGSWGGLLTVIKMFDINELLLPKDFSKACVKVVPL